MYQIDPLRIKKHGCVPNKDRENLCKCDQVLCYLHAWDKSNGFAFGYAACRNRFIAHFLHKVLKMEELPGIEEQFKIIYDNFKLFKKVLNKTKGNEDEIE